MPTYDYRCQSCGHALEIFQSMSEPAKKKCPQCGKPKLERLIGAGAAILFKGGGFYQTDYRSDSYKKAESAEKGASSGDAGAKPADSTSSSTPSTPSTGEGAKTPAKESASKSASERAPSARTDGARSRSKSGDAAPGSSGKRSKKDPD